jgi:hypothetical protein
MRFIIFIAIFIVLTHIAPQEVAAQEMKTGVVSQAYSNLSIDMQYYEIKYDPNSSEYVTYYQVIREKLMRKLKGLYRYHYRKGDVYLLFNLKSDGKLTRFDIDNTKSTKDKTLINIVASSLKQSSPFPQFPKELGLPDLSFNIVISFKEE